MEADHDGAAAGPGDVVSGIDRVPELVQRLYALVGELAATFPGRPFTPDGHLVGSLGEVIAAHKYGLTLHPPSTKGHDATASDGRQVEVKATQGSRVQLRHEPAHLIVLQLDRQGHASEVYNGPGILAWAACGPMQSNGQRAISLSRLRTLMAQVPAAQRLAAHA